MIGSGRQFRIPLFPIEFGGLQQAQGSHHIGLREGEGVFDGAVHMALGGEVDDAVDVFVLHQLVDTLEVAYVHLDEAIIRLVLDVFQVSEVAGVGQLVEVDDLVFRIFVDEEADDVAADEAGAASNDDGSFRTHDFCFFSNTDLSDLHGDFAQKIRSICVNPCSILFYSVFTVYNTLLSICSSSYFPKLIKKPSLNPVAFK